MISIVNESNELCSAMGRTKYNYIPEIQTQIGADGKKKAIVMCWVYPDRDKDFYNSIHFEDLEDKVF